MIGNQIFELTRKLYPICRSITGNGVRETLKIIKSHIPDIKVFEVPTGTNAFDWTVPKEWNINDAYVIDPNGDKIIDFQKSNLHVVGYSTPISKTVSLEEFQNHLYSIPEQPNAIPYITSYYKERWGFCITDEQRKTLKPGEYYVYIDSSLTEGSLTYAELILSGKSNREVFLSTYICHPSLANNELSGPAVTTFISKWLMSLESRKYTYRIVFIPETIGSIVYLSRNLEAMKKKVIAGFNITCIGDDRSYSYLQSRYGDTLADRVALHVLKNMKPDFIKYSYLDRGSDERQYCSPGIDLPVASIMRTKYGQYPEYHTSLDNLKLITPAGLLGGYEVLKTCIECIENNEKLAVTVLCEPQLGKRDLYPTLGTKKSTRQVEDMKNLIAYSDGKNDLVEIAEIINVPMWKLYPLIAKLKDNSLLKVIE